jgi:hypothetical protein
VGTSPPSRKWNGEAPSNLALKLEEYRTQSRAQGEEWLRRHADVGSEGYVVRFRQPTDPYAHKRKVTPCTTLTFRAGTHPHACDTGGASGRRVEGQTRRWI